MKLKIPIIETTNFNQFQPILINFYKFLSISKFIEICFAKLVEIKKNLLLVMCVLCIVISPSVQAAIIDTYEETFDSREDDATIDEVDSWNVDQGQTQNAITQDATTQSGSGKALELIGAETAVNVSRAATYGSLSPCWIEFIVKPGMGAQSRNVPSGKLAAVYFSYNGKIYAANGSSWVDTGQTFSADNWYRIILKLNFSTHEYDIYIEPVAAPKIEFIADKEKLNFIDTSINSLSQLGFEGVYNSSRSDDTYLDDLIVHFIDRLEIITPPQTLMEEQLSSPITVQLQNSYSEPQTAWKDIVLELRSSSDKGDFSLDRDNWKSISTVIIPENAQAVTFYYKDIKEGKPIITVKEYPDRGWEEASQQEKIVTEAKYFEVTAVSPQTAGEPFTIQITAKDDEGQINEYYSGEVEILANYVSPASGTKAIAPDSLTGFSKGVAETEISYPDCGTIEIMVRDAEEPSKIGLSGDILFIPDKFSVSVSSPQVVSRNFPITVSALNKQGEITPNYQGPAVLSAIAVSPLETDGSILPAALSETNFSAGLAETNITYNRWGTIKMKVHDLAYPDKQGQSEAVSFLPSAILIEVKPPSVERGFFYVGESIPVAISIVDDAKIPIINYQGVINLSSSLGLGLAEEYEFSVADQGKHIFLTSASSAGLYQVVASEETVGAIRESPLQAKSPDIEVKEAKLEVISTIAPVGTTEVTIKLVDAEGNIIVSENELTLTVALEEEYADSSASSSTIQAPVTFYKGVAKVLVSNSQAETVTLSPSSTLDFKTKKGTVTFGRMAKTGIGTLMYREIKE